MAIFKRSEVMNVLVVVRCWNWIWLGLSQVFFFLFIIGSFFRKEGKVYLQSCLSSIVLSVRSDKSVSNEHVYEINHLNKTIIYEKQAGYYVGKQPLLLDKYSAKQWKRKYRYMHWPPRCI